MIRLMLACCALAACVEVALCEEPSSGAGNDDYWVIVVPDGPPGAAPDGEGYEMAVYRLPGESAPSRFAALSSLCVSHTLVGQYRHARHHCNAALEATARAADEKVPEGGDGATALALAYANRGVLLVRTGDAEAALQDFRMALALQPGTELPRHNLLRLTANAPRD